MKIFADTADLGQIQKLNEYISGVTTNPTIIRKQGVTDYLGFSRDLVNAFPLHDISLEVLSDAPDEMLRQAEMLAGLGKNVYVKIPIVDTAGNSCENTIRALHLNGVRVNVTAVMTIDQVQQAVSALRSGDAPAIISVFAGRIMDTLFTPPYLPQRRGHISFLWASTREIYNYRSATQEFYDIITMPPEMITKMLALRYKNLTEYSKETVQMFVNDAKAAGYTL